MKARHFVVLGLIAINTMSMNGQSSQNQAADLKPSKSTKITIRGYVRDIACLMKYNEALKPTNDCAIMCARAGSPVVVITKEGAIYTPISDSIPDSSQREKLMPFVGSYVEITGEAYERAGMRAIVIEKIQKADDAKS